MMQHSIPAAPPVLPLSVADIDDLPVRVAFDDRMGEVVLTVGRRSSVFDVNDPVSWASLACVRDALTEVLGDGEV